MALHDALLRLTSSWRHRLGAQTQSRRRCVWVDHLDPRQVAQGDAVIGSLPIHLVADVCARGATYQHLQFDVSPQQRGRELEADDLDALGARLVGYRVAVCDATSILCKEI